MTAKQYKQKLSNLHRWYYDRATKVDSYVNEKTRYERVCFQSMSV